MPAKGSTIPINPMHGELRSGIFVGRGSVNGMNDFKQSTTGTFENSKHSHRDDYHLFFIQEEGTTAIQIDFQKHEAHRQTLFYIAPGQVHRMEGFRSATVSFLAIETEHISPLYTRILEELTPALPLTLDNEAFSIVADSARLCIHLFGNSTPAPLSQRLLRDSCNTLIGLIATCYSGRNKLKTVHSRFENVAKAFKTMLEQQFKTIRQPAEYARKLNISTPYLNECVREVTGHPVSYHIQQRIVLEAKRLLHHSEKSVKEIAFELGYDDYPYFTRLFSKVTGMTALTFRNKNRD